MVRAKFVVNRIEKTMGFRKNDRGTHSKAEMISVHMQVVGGDTEENKKFFESTPSGNITIGILSEDVANLLQLDKEYYVDFTPVERT